MRPLDPYGWRVHIDEGYPALTSDCVRVILYRDSGDGMREVVTGISASGAPVRYRVAQGEVLPDEETPPGFMLPIGAVQAIAEAVKPGPSQGELQVLTEALEIERTRVDRLLELVGRPPALSVEHTLREDLGPLASRKGDPR